MVRIFFILAAILALVYILYAGYVYYVQRWVIFPRHLLPPTKTTIADFPSWQQRWIEVADVRVESWFAPPTVSPNPGAAPLFIIAHGNGELMDSWPLRVAQLQRQGYGVLLVEYPGYGRSTGEPSEDAIAATLVNGYDWAVTQPGLDRDRIILFGFSVGGGAIGTLAVQRPSAALVLMSTFTRIPDMAGRFYLPGFLARDSFDNIAAVRDYTNPTY
ncbi:MAG: alpha/beta fold hydrolase [Caldilineaceae bacterium]